MITTPIDPISDVWRVSSRRMREQIARRTPRPGAERRIAVSATPHLERFDDDTRLSGPRDDVLDYAAFLFATDTGYGDTRLDVASVEFDDGGELTLLLRRPRTRTGF
jgi:hypothetical protein